MTNKERVEKVLNLIKEMSLKKKKAAFYDFTSKEYKGIDSVIDAIHSTFIDTDAGDAFLYSGNEIIIRKNHVFIGNSSECNYFRQLLERYNYNNLEIALLDIFLGYKIFIKMFINNK